MCEMVRQCMTQCTALVRLKGATLARMNVRCFMRWPTCVQPQSVEEIKKIVEEARSSPTAKLGFEDYLDEALGGEMSLGADGGAPGGI